MYRVIEPLHFNGRIRAGIHKKRSRFGKKRKRVRYMDPRYDKPLRAGTVPRTVPTSSTDLGRQHAKTLAEILRELGLAGKTQFKGQTSQLDGPGPGLRQQGIGPLKPLVANVFTG